ncbi:ranBP2-type zinc finger protein At1g67325-like [Zingiber officinale]|uniref:ranBP2-type zinc finger protein At1g67325-like n=1 Tax=Zingiber officinale TaxID=94328 RepID=UPI001C4A888B|nr:ranBP2-type zinc finger protein At1g67325-like [Zingiber officinale]
MSQVDNRNPSAGKRARTDGGRREDDWTCPSCGNVNFSFRTTCNMRNCTQPRPADHNGKFAPKSMQAPPPYAPAGYVGYGTPSSMYLRTPPYGSSVFNGHPLPPYDMPFSGGSAYLYEYGNRLSVGSPYGPLHLSGPYSAGPMMGAGGGGYGMPPPMVDRYGLGLRVDHGPMGPRSGAYPEESSQKKNAGEGRENDWKCPNCGNNNFSFRTVCNMRKCNTPRPGSQGFKSENSKGSKPKMPEGSWKCEKCNNINYPFRTKCNRQNCGAEKPSESHSPGPSSNEDDQ